MARTARPSTTPPRLTLEQARAVQLEAQGLLTAPRRRATLDDVAAVFARIHLVQIDTIHVVARSPYMVLFSRLGPYTATLLDELLERGRVFECWAHEACFAPIGDYALHRRSALARTGHWAMRHALRAQSRSRADMDALLARIRETGPVRTSDFEGPSGAKKSGWWSWKPEKRWLEALFALGELMVARRERFQRVYDLRERVLALSLPGWDDAAVPPADEVQRRLVERAVSALGVTPARFVADYFRMPKRLRDADLEPLVQTGDLVRVDVDGWDAPGYVHRDRLAVVRRASSGALVATHTTLLSPFDPIVWDRERARATFGFDYRLECYTPAPKRKYGYYVLPILHRGRLVGRLDAKAHRADGIFEVKALFLEPDVSPTSELVADIAGALRSCADWHGTSRVVIRRTRPRAIAKLLRSSLSALDSES